MTRPTEDSIDAGVWAPMKLYLPPELPAIAALFVDASSAVIHADDVASDLYGRDELPLLGQPVSVALGPVWLGSDEADARGALERDGHWRGLTEHQTRSGVRQVEQVARLFCDGAAQPTGLALHTEIADWRNRRIGLRQGLDESEQRRHDHWTGCWMRLRSLQAVSSDLATADQLEDAARVVLCNLVPASEARAGLLAVAEPDGALRVVATLGHSVTEVERWFELSGKISPLTTATHQDRPLWLGDPRSREAAFPDLAEVYSGGSMCALPMRIAGSTVGVIGLSFSGRRPFDHDERSFLMAMARHAALAVERTLGPSEVHQVARWANRALGPGRSQAERSRASGSLHLEVDTGEAARARRFTAGVCAGLAKEVADTVQLCVSELVANVIMHARTAGLLHIDVDGDRVLVDVTDQSEQQPRIVAEPDAQGGRGLRILAALARRWGTTTAEGNPPGKTVWAEIELPLRR